MIEYIVSLMVAIAVGLFYWWRINRSFWVSVMISGWCFVGPDFPKVFLNHNAVFVNIGGWCFALILLVLILSKNFSGKKKYLSLLWFVEIGLVLHLTIDYIFKGGVV